MLFSIRCLVSGSHFKLCGGSKCYCLHQLIDRSANLLRRELPTFTNRPQFRGILVLHCDCLPNNTMLGARLFKKSKQKFCFLGQHYGVLTQETKFYKFKKSAVSITPIQPAQCQPCKQQPPSVSTGHPSKPLNRLQCLLSIAVTWVAATIAKMQQTRTLFHLCLSLRLNSGLRRTDKREKSVIVPRSGGC